MTDYPGLFPYKGNVTNPKGDPKIGLTEAGLDLENAGLFTLLLALPKEQREDPSRRVAIATKWNQVREPRNSEALKNMRQGDSSAGLPPEDFTWLEDASIPGWDE